MVSQPLFTVAVVGVVKHQNFKRRQIGIARRPPSTPTSSGEGVW